MHHPLLLRACFVALAAFATSCVDGAGKHRVQANAFLRQGDAAAALKECDEGLALKKDDLPLLILRGKALFELGQMDESKVAYERALDVGKGEEPRSLAEAHLGLGMVASRKEDWKLARSEFEALVKINPRDAYSHLNVAKACLAAKDMACAIEHGEEAGKLRGNEERVLYALGTIYLAADKKSEAELTFNHICEVAPGAASCPYGLALVAARSGDKAKALEKLADAVSKKVPNPESIAKEADFAALKDDPAFLALVAKATQK